MSDLRKEPDIWAAMRRTRRCHYLVRPLRNPGLLAMLTVWAKVDSPLMHAWSTEITGFSADLLADLDDALREGGWDLEREVLPAILSLLTWTDEGPRRDGEPEEFMSDVIATLEEGSAALASIW